MMKPLEIWYHCQFYNIFSASGMIQCSECSLWRTLDGLVHPAKRQIGVMAAVALSGVVLIWIDGHDGWWACH